MTISSTETTSSHFSIEVLIHHVDDVPDTDLTTVDGVPCTTAVRTIIDIAPEIEAAELDRALDDCLVRGLFTVEEVEARLAAQDMVSLPGARRVREALLRRER